MSQRSVIIIGDKGVGKTTLIYKFLDKDEVTKSTLAMDYSFGRKTSKQMSKDLIHVWEIGHLAPSLISAALAGAVSMHPIHHTTLIIMLNLSVPQKLWHTLEECLSAARRAIEMNCDATNVAEMRKRRKNEPGPDNRKFIDPFPLNVCIVGGQYDKIKNSELASKEMIGRTLRAVAFYLKADLQYYSSKDSTLVRKMRELLSHYGFDSQPIKDSHCDYKNALIIPSSGVDSFDTSEFNKYAIDCPERFIDTIKNIYLGQFHYEVTEDKCELDNLINDGNFNEAIIDKLRSQRDKEIEMNLQEMMDGNSIKNTIVITDPH